MGIPLTADERREIRRLARSGLTYQEIGAVAGRSLAAVCRTVKGGVGGHRAPLVEWSPGPGRLSVEEREEIGLGVAGGESFAEIARRLGRRTSTVSREVNADGGRRGYRATRAHRRAYERARRPKITKFAASADLLAVVEGLLGQWWSPIQISRWLHRAFPHDPMMQVSHETIYQAIYVQGRGELRRELARCLRSGRVERRPQGRMEHRGRIPGMVSISQRPAEVEDRAVPGHWEGDLIVGKNSRSAIATLVERSTRYVMLAKITDQTASTVREAIVGQIMVLPAHLRRSLTWDRGKEMADHLQFSIDTDVAVYFCDPRSPWQRGSNENTNGLLRQYFPKGSDLSVHSQQDLDAAAHSLNNRPRETLGWLKPSEKLTELLVADTG